MTQKSTATLALLGMAVLAGAALALGAGRPPLAGNEGVREIREEARFPGRALFLERGCVQCHGKDGSGTEMGPGLGAVMAEYLASTGGDEEAAKARLIAYLKEPKKIPTLRKDPTHYANPMPSAAGLGLDEDGVRKVADYVMGFRPSSVAVGGDAKSR
jgi:mono/diheme cytochrome c family protein